MKIVWSLFAISDREAIFDYIEADSPRAAARIDDQIETQVDQLMTFPEIGKPGRVAGRVSLFFSKLPTSPPTASSEIRYGSCAYCMELSGGQMSSKISMSPQAQSSFSGGKDCYSLRSAPW